MRLPVFVLAVVLWISPCEAQQKKVYDWTFVNGRTITFSESSDQTMKTTLGGAVTDDIRYQITSTSARRTLSIKNQKAELELGPTKMRVEVTYGKASAKWDSENRRLRKARSLPYIKPFAEQFERKILFSMDIPGRKVSNVRFELTNRGKSLGNPPPTQMVGQSIEEGRHLFPTTPVGVGDSWDWDLILPVDNDHLIIMKGKQKLIGFGEHRGKRCVRLEGSRKGVVAPAQEGQQVRIKVLEARETSTHVFDVEQGFLVKAETESFTKTSKVIEVAGEGKKTEVRSHSEKSTFQLESVKIEGR